MEAMARSIGFKITMKIKKTAVRLSAIATLLVVSSTQAQWNLGAGGISSDASYRGVDRDNFVIPVVGYEGERLYFRGLELGYRLNQASRRSPHQWAVVVTGAPFRFRPNDSRDPQMRLLDSRSFSAELALDYQFSTPFGVFDARAGHDIRGNGHRLSASYAYPLSPNPRKWQLSPSIGVSYISSGYTDYYYGVSATEAERSGLAEYGSQDAFNPNLRLSGYYRIDERWNLFGAISASRLSSKIANSPMADGRYISTAILAVSYSF
ncbi:hypothetical protein CWE12_01920 [Aliidiomarina sedimenti]|uniref:MipA/OmpV family protein n=2 Tax=Aliidiomarina sedimenti TaxID=1933879 RepID=A0ABY0C1W8_9GAMM|nr:hypothetical protein CWE12_01920 [Aliidiomarina sedimenti]